MKKNYKINVLGIIIVGLFIILPLVGASVEKVVAAEQKVFNWKLANHVPSTSKGMAVQDRWWAQELGRRSNGRITVKVYYGDELCGPYELLSAVKSRLADAVNFTPGYTPGVCPMFNAGYLPFLGAVREDHQILVQNRLAKESKPYIDEMEKLNTVWGGSYSAPCYNLMGKKPVRTVNDLKGLRIRGLAGVNEIIKEFGAVPVAISTTEIFSALQTGIVDVVAHSVSSFRSYRVDELSKYLTIDMDMAAQPAPILINKNAWNELPDDLKKVVQSVIDDCPAFMWDLYHEPSFVDEMKSVIKKQGIETIHFPKSERAKLEVKAEAVWEDWAKRSGNYEAAKQALADYIRIRDEVNAKYPEGVPGIKYR